MKKLIAIVSLVAFTVAVQAGGDSCCSKTKTSTAAAQDNHACCSKTLTSTASTQDGKTCSKTMTSAQTKAACSASQASCCSGQVMAKKTLVSHVILSPKAAAAL